MKLLITGLPADANAEAVMEGMKKFGTVTHVEIVPNGQADTWAIIEMAITHEQAFSLTQTVNDIWYQGNRSGRANLNRAISGKIC
ncbi:MAG: RNA recognition motif domain-containing protein [Fluviibacter phosphoraccumulans]